MIIKQITLHNFGIYKGKHKVDLAPPYPDKPIILFGGLNGRGKTTLLDGLQLCFYGKHAKCSNRGSQAYELFLESCIYKGAGINQAAVYVTFEHMVDGETHSYEICRWWKKSGKSCKEFFEVLRNGSADHFSSENWDSIIEDFIPNNISHLFFFDGEKIESYANDELSSDLVRTGIENLLGLDVVDRLQRDLVRLENVKRKEVGKAKSKEIVDAEESLARLNHRRKEITNKLASLKTDMKNETEQKAKAEVEFRKLGGDLYEKRNNLEERKRDLDKEIKEPILKELTSLSNGILPILLLADGLEKSIEQDKAEKKAKLSREAISLLKRRDGQLIDLMEKFDINDDVKSSLINFMKEDVKTREDESHVPQALNLSDETYGHFKSIMNNMEENIGRLKIFKKLFLEKSADLNHIEDSLSKVPDEHLLADVLNRLSEINKKIGEIREEEWDLGREKESIEKELKAKEVSLHNVLEKEAKNYDSQIDGERMIVFSGEVRSRLDLFRSRVTEKNIKKIEGLILESFSQLIMKNTLVSDLKISIDDFSISLLNHSGAKIGLDKLSAGERQLLSIAILWGMARSSSRILPTVIDTPLGRLDSHHRSNLIKHYFPHASHQVILLSTDEEIAGEYLQKLSPWIGRSYELVYDEENASTSIKEGYFAKRENSHVN